MASRGLILAVVDSLRPDALERAVRSGAAPTLAALVAAGDGIRPLLSVFPSLTPAAAATIATGAPVDVHRIPSINWYSRDEQRYVEYGTSLAASRAFGVLSVLSDTVYNLNLAHLPRDVPTIFERLEDAGLVCACTTYLVFRGRHRHRPTSGPGVARLATATRFRQAVWGPRELFYADLFASRELPCSSLLGLPGRRDPHAACVAEHLLREDAFDFLLLSLPDTDTRSHRLGPRAQHQALASAERALERVVKAAGGVDALLDRYAVVVCSDHGQSAVERTLDLGRVLSDRRLLRPVDPRPADAELALSPGGRITMVYALVDDRNRRSRLLRRLRRRLRDLPGVAFVASKVRGEAVIEGPGGELRFAPGDDTRDEYGDRWSFSGATELLELSYADGLVRSARYPRAFARLWSALSCATAGDLFVVAEPGVEFVDWGGASHLGGGSHGGLDAEDSTGVLVAAGLEAVAPERDDRYLALTDLVPLALRHFSVSPTH
ncbi:alkaline phosphatase family protein [Thermoleophilum album]|uniref:Type I phosphodiesterase / nucleotide pyrophosphatase n=1 Tax=Thermoleophilum album TaxID=29539 RepID=A0A1H6FJV1_THEAL|nr:alkaline phosphatase family protein [Thermoleophilum album]SEH11131.1 Type I phosphodiesterase / nucleotide pyrophosphatase [Thermoleophilum album]